MDINNITRRQTRKVVLGGHDGVRRVEVGGEAPITLQTMWKDGIAHLARDEAARKEVARQVSALASFGCDIVRFAVPDMESARALCALSAECETPLVADIHFDHRLALASLEGYVAGIRINPGNIGRREYVEKVAASCAEKGVPIRIGVNTGSLPKDLTEKVDRAAALVEAAMREVAVFNEVGFRDVVVSMKSSDVSETIRANEIFASKSDIPLHIGVTEAGPLIGGVVKSSLAFGALLHEGIGETIRVSLSSTPENEVIAGREILRECGVRQGGVRIVSCPRCGRLGFDVHGFVARWQNTLLAMDKDITVAVMGCVVNGPGEGRHADIGIAGANGKAIIFKKGKIVRTIDDKDADNAFREELESL